MICDGQRVRWCLVLGLSPLQSVTRPCRHFFTFLRGTHPVIRREVVKVKVDLSATNEQMNDRRGGHQMRGRAGFVQSLLFTAVCLEMVVDMGI